MRRVLDIVWGYGLIAVLVAAFIVAAVFYVTSGPGPGEVRCEHAACEGP